LIVVDASVVLEVLLQTGAAGLIEQRIFASHEILCAPHLLDVESAQVLRRYVLSGIISADRGAEAIQDLADLRLNRYPHEVLLPRIWQLRHNLTAYDAAYVALAEALDAPLLTRDKALALASSTAQVEIL
jgi:predicted nucleic acid-binding protein